MSFVHLHTHSQNSLLDGMLSEDRLVERIKELGQNSIAVTDHGVLFGAVKLQKAAQKAGVKGIIGMEAYVATGGDHTRPAKSMGDNFHLTLLAQNEQGYRNLQRLSSIAHLHGLSFKPRIDYDLLDEYSEGLIVLSGCIGAEIPQRIVRGDSKGAESLARRLRKTFNGRFFIEVMNHGATGGIDHVRIENGGVVEMTETDLNMALVALADKLGVGVVATNDAHYLTREDGEAHDTLLCLGTGAWKDKPNRLAFPGSEHAAWEFYIKSEEEFRAISDEPWWQTAITNTQTLADTIEENVVPMGMNIMPKYEAPDDDFAFKYWLETGEII